jgi:hypothetical protein
MGSGSDDSLGANEVGVAPNIDNDRRGFGTEPFIQVVR